MSAKINPWGAVLLSIGLLGIGAGIALLASSATARRTAVVLTAGGLIMATIGGIRLKVPIELGVELDLDLQGRTAQKGDLPPRFELRQVASLSSFEDAKHEMNVAKVQPIVNKMLSENLHDSKPLGWLIVGRVDKRNLRPNSVRTYGSNQGLAMARATWVRDNILRNNPFFDRQRAVVTIGGPEHLGSLANPTGMTADRAVEIYALVEKGQAEPLDVAETSPD